MNGTLTARWNGRATRSYSIIGIATPGNLDVHKGDLYDIFEDHYGNTYAVVDGVEFFVDKLERVDEITEWFAPGLVARDEYLSAILDRTERPVEPGPLRDQWTAERDAARKHLADLAPAQ